MFQERARTVQGLYLFLDALAIGLAFGAALLLRIFHDSIPVLQILPSLPWIPESEGRSEYAILLVANLFAWTIYLRRTELYVTAQLQRSAAVITVYIKALAVCVLATGAVAFALKILVSRLLFGYFYGMMLVLIIGKQLILARALEAFRRNNLHRRHALVIGAERPANWLGKIILDAGYQGYALVGLLLDREATASRPDAPVLGTIEDLNKVLLSYPVDEVFMVGSASEIAGMAPVAQDLIEKGRVVSLVSIIGSGANGVRGRVTDFNGVPMISFGPMPRDEIRSNLKRVMDVSISALTLLALSPVLCLVALLIKILDPGPVLFRQERLGLGGRRFDLYKFRSMRVDAEVMLQADPRLYRRYIENDHKIPASEDPRISRLGRFLRRTSLDELPQFWNVLKGDMTLVGPRPIFPGQVDEYQPYVPLFLSVRPGLTGRWQISGRSEVAYPERAFLDLDYVGKNSLTEDLAIMARTVPAVLRRRGAY